MLGSRTPPFAAGVRLRGAVNEEALALLLTYWNRRLYEGRRKDWT